MPNRDLPKYDAEPETPEVRFRKRKLKTQEKRDEWNDDLVADLYRAEKTGDWKEYNRIKDLMFKTT